MFFSKNIPDLWIEIISKPEFEISTYLELGLFIVFNIKMRLKTEKSPNVWQFLYMRYPDHETLVNYISKFRKTRKIDFIYVKFELVAAPTDPFRLKKMA